MFCSIYELLKISLEKYRQQVSMNGPSGISSGCGERCYFVSKHNNGSTLSSPNITDTKGSRKREKENSWMPATQYLFHRKDYQLITVIIESYLDSKTNLKSYRTVWRINETREQRILHYLGQWIQLQNEEQIELKF